MHHDGTIASGTRLVMEAEDLVVPDQRGQPATTGRRTGAYETRL
jgi:hypothetical protein